MSLSGDGYSSESSDDYLDNFGEFPRQKRSLAKNDFRGSKISEGHVDSPIKASVLDKMQIPDGNPKFNTTKLFYCKTGYFLKMEPNGKVLGTQDENDKNGLIQVTSAGQAGHVHLKGVLSNLYVAFDKKGKLYGEPNKEFIETVWIEEVLGLYNIYLSKCYAHLGWHLAIKRSGKAKKGTRSAWGQKSIQFLPKSIEL